MLNQFVAVFDRIDGALGFSIVTAPVPEPGPGEVRFKVQAFALNQADLLLTEGRHFMQADLPIRLGYEGCGTVDAVGKDVTRFKSGDKVTCLPNVDGPYWTAGEYALADQNFLTIWPQGWSVAQAAGLWMQYLTPYFPFVELFPVQSGDWVMITAATGGTGLGSVRMAKLLGARVIATTRSDSKISALMEHGADHVLSTDRSDFAAEVRRITDGAGVRLINDTLCGRYVPMLAETLADRGIMFVHGALGGDNQLSLPILTLVYRRAGIYGYSLINELRRPDARVRGLDFISEALFTGALPPPTIDRIFPFKQLTAAYERMRRGEQTGKIVVSLDV